MCHVKGDICHVTGDMCHVTGYMGHIFFLQSCGASRSRVCYQQGLPRLVLADLYNFR